MKIITSSVAQKFLMALTGFFLISFLIVHLTGNFLLFKGDDGVAFNAYTHFMSTTGMIRIIELVLLVGFLLHFYIAWRTTRHNQQTRLQNYFYNNPSASSSWASRNMGLIGLGILIFLIIHLHNFWFRYKFQADIPLVQGTNYKDMLWLVQTIFIKEWWFTIIYILAMILLSFHLIHGFESAFQSLGLNHKKYTPFIKKIGVLFAILIPASFAMIPIMVLLL